MLLKQPTRNFEQFLFFRSFTCGRDEMIIETHFDKMQMVRELKGFSERQTDGQTYG